MTHGYSISSRVLYTLKRTNDMILHILTGTAYSLYKARKSHQNKKKKVKKRKKGIFLLIATDQIHFPFHRLKHLHQVIRHVCCMCHVYCTCQRRRMAKIMHILDDIFKTVKT